MRICSPAFSETVIVPDRYTLVGGNVSPPVRIERMPEGTQSLVVILDHPLTSRDVCTHWVVYNIPPTPRWAEGCVPGTQAINDFEVHRYVGPFPRHGLATYRLGVYALSGVLLLGGGKGRADVEKAMQGLVIEKAEKKARCDACGNGNEGRRSVASYAAALPPKARLPLACQRR
jgi:Raf kinase inhibitor-like YbhB/YbcL family protein